MKKPIIAIIMMSCACLNVWAAKLVNAPFVIGDETYWLVLNDTLKEKGAIWDYDSAEPPPLLPNEVIKTSREILSNQKIADLKWKIKSVNLEQQTGTQNQVQEDGTTNSTHYSYSYYEVELLEDLRPNTPEWNRRFESGNTTLAQISLIVKMNGEVVLPEKGKHLKDILSPELWEKYKLRKGIEQKTSPDKQ